MNDHLHQPYLALMDEAHRTSDNAESSSALVYCCVLGRYGG